MSKKGSNGKSMSFDDLAVDVEKEIGGDWFPLGDKAPGVEFKLRSPHCMDFKRHRNGLQQKYKAYKIDATGASADSVAVERAYHEAIAELLILDWRGISEPYSKELARELMGNQKWRKWSMLVSAIVARLEADEEVARSEEGKGYEQPSATGSSTTP